MVDLEVLVRDLIHTDCTDLLFLTLVLDGGEWSASCPSCFTPCTRWIRGWARPTAGLNAVEKRNISWPCFELDPSHPAHSPSLYWLSYLSEAIPPRPHVSTTWCFINYLYWLYRFYLKYRSSYVAEIGTKGCMASNVFRNSWNPWNHVSVTSLLCQV
jgi:hypothetical protein